MILFCDTSALVKLYVAEEGSDLMRIEADAVQALAVSRLAWAEAMAALARRVRESPVDETAIQQARGRLRGHWNQYLVVEASQVVVEQAGELAETFALRAYDAIQLASARLLMEQGGVPVAFACFDSRLRKAARVLGMASVPAE